MNINGRVIAMSVVGLLATACGPKAGAPKITNAGAGGGSGSGAVTDDNGEKQAKVMCQGVNACKGQGACAVNACAGSNKCKGLGWLSLTEAQCSEKGGTVVGAKPATVPVGTEATTVQ